MPPKKNVTKSVPPQLGANEPPPPTEVDKRTLAGIMQRRVALQEQIARLDDRIFELETTCLRDGVLLSSLFDITESVNVDASYLLRSKRKSISDEDRIFSRCSATCKRPREQE